MLSPESVQHDPEADPGPDLALCLFEDPIGHSWPSLWTSADAERLKAAPLRI